MKIELTRQQLEVLVRALDYHHDGLYQEHQLEERKKEAPPGVREYTLELVDLADMLEAKLADFDEN